MKTDWLLAFFHLDCLLFFLQLQECCLVTRNSSAMVGPVLSSESSFGCWLPMLSQSVASASWEGASGTPLTIPQSSGCECSPTFFAGLANVQHAASVKSKVLVYMLVPPNSQLAECNVNLIQLFSVVSQYCLSVFSIQAHDTKSFLRLWFSGCWSATAAEVFLKWHLASVVCWQYQVSMPKGQGSPQCLL